MARFERRGFGGRRFGGGFGGGFRERDDTPKPVNVGEEYDVEITEVGSKGDGIARVKNFVVFVANGKQGEKTKIKIKEVRERFAIGEKVGAAGEVKTAEESTEEVEVAEETTEEPVEEVTEEVTEEVETEGE